eukprot:IDg16253t1
MPVATVPALRRVQNSVARTGHPLPELASHRQLDRSLLATIFSRSSLIRLLFWRDGDDRHNASRLHRSGLAMNARCTGLLRSHGNWAYRGEHALIIT